MPHAPGAGWFVPSTSATVMHDMTVLDTHVRRDSEEFQDNTRHFESLVTTLRERLRLVYAAGGEERP